MARGKTVDVAAILGGQLATVKCCVMQRWQRTKKRFGRVI